MKSIAVEKDYSMRFVDIDMPQIDSCSALVKVLASGICGSDAKIMRGTFKNIRGYPCLIGHEAVGEVIETGKDVESFKVGDKILLPFVEGRPNGYESFWGGFSEYGICRDWRAMAKNGVGPGTRGFSDHYYTQKTIPQDFDPVNSVMIITLREVLAAVHHFGLSSGNSVVIYGAGAVGLAFIKFAHMMGCSPVISVDVVDDKMPDALKLGADYVFNSTKTDVAGKIRELCPDGVDYAIDAVGVNSLIMDSFKILKDNGRIYVYGVSPVLSMNLDWSEAPYNWSMDFFQFPLKQKEAEVHQQIINWVRSGALDLSDFISHVFDFKDAMKGFDIMRNHLPAKKIVIKY